MAITAPTPITAAPPVPDSGQPEPTFDAQYEAFNTWERQQLVPGANALAQITYQNALEAKAAKDGTDGAVAAATVQADAAMGYRDTANNAATTATQQASVATGAAELASSKRDDAVAAAGQAVPARDQAVAARDTAVAAAAQAGAPLAATSTTSLTVSVATKALDVGLGKGFVPGQLVTIARTSAPATVWMRGTVLSYSNTGAGPLSVAERSDAGGTFTDWSIGITGARGANSTTLPVVGVSVVTTGASNVFYRLDAAVALTMTASPVDGDFFAFANRSGGAPTVNPNGKKIKGDAGVMTLDTLNASACLKYDAANGDWVESFAGFTVASVSSNAILLQPNTWASKQSFAAGVEIGGAGAPAIRHRLYAGTTPSAQGSTVTLSLAGVDFRKVLGMQAVVQSANDAVNEGNAISTGFQFVIYANTSGIVLQLHASNSANILSKPFTVLVTYTE